ncbi:MAG: J domain-containing protein [Bacteroidales bacterium]|nr:J domain-containing protein [Bacteroidales bacterium]MBN2820886.1 J domain-containing protein [Bacteroidales bacterium]
MNYFNGITDLEKAKLQYRKLAKKLHPDKGGTVVESQKMRDEYKTLLLRIQYNFNVNITSVDLLLHSSFVPFSSILLQ